VEAASLPLSSTAVKGQRQGCRFHIKIRRKTFPFLKKAFLSLLAPLFSGLRNAELVSLTPEFF